MNLSDVDNPLTSESQLSLTSSRKRERSVNAKKCICIDSRRNRCVRSAIDDPAFYRTDESNHGTMTNYCPPCWYGICEDRGSYNGKSLQHPSASQILSEAHRLTTRLQRIIETLTARCGSDTG
jgi:hypothetical protein